MRFTIPGRLPTLNEEIAAAKAHWSRYAAHKKAYTALAKGYAKQLTPIKGCFTVHCYWFVKNKRSDPDNISFALKYILDGLVEAKILPNDGWHQISGICHSFAVDATHPRVEVELTATVE